MIAKVFGNGLILGLLSMATLAGQPKDLANFRTVTGDYFDQVRVLKTDGSGAYFRHSRGIARVPFADMPVAIRNQFPVNQPATRRQSHPRSNAKDQPTEKPTGTPIRWIVLHKPASPALSTAKCGVLFQRPACGLPYPHALAIYSCRKKAELDFFYVTGLLPAPRGLQIRTLPR